MNRLFAAIFGWLTPTATKTYQKTKRVSRRHPTRKGPGRTGADPISPLKREHGPGRKMAKHIPSGISPRQRAARGTSAIGVNGIRGSNGGGR